MDEHKIKALISLLDDEDAEVFTHVEREFMTMGESVIPFLEREWEKNFNPIVQKRIEELIHNLHFELLKFRFKNWKKEGAKDLLEGMWLVATYQYPDIELNKMKEGIEAIFYETWPEMKPEMTTHDQIRTLNNVIFNQLKFGANTKNFHSPSNSMINVVLETRKGNPISLCVIYMLIAQKHRMPIYGVNLPNLFILTFKSETEQFYINVFNKGLIFTRSDIDSYLAHLNLNQLEIFYEPCNNLDIVKRVLRNLLVSFEKLGDSVKMEEITALFNVIADDNESIS